MHVIYIPCKYVLIFFNLGGAVGLKTILSSMAFFFQDPSDCQSVLFYNKVVNAFQQQIIIGYRKMAHYMTQFGVCISAI